MTAVAYGPGGKRLAAAYRDGTIRLWDIASHRLLSTATWGGAALALAFTGGGKALEVAGPAAVGTWNLTGEAKIAVRALAGLTGGRCVAFSPDGATLATGGGDGNVRLWDVATRQEIGAPMSSDLKPVEAVTFSPTARRWPRPAATGPSSCGTRPPSRRRARPWRPARPRSALATAGSDGGTELWAFATQEQTGTALGSGRASALAFNPDADILATGDRKGTIELWDPAGFHQSSAPIATGRPESPAAAGGHASPTAGGHAPAVLSTRGDVLAVSDDRGTVRLRNALTRRPGLADREPSGRDRTGAQP